MKRLFQWFLKALAAGVITVVILSVFCYFYSYDGIHIESPSGVTDYVWESGQLKATMKEGFSRVRMDSYGYNNMFDYSNSPDILLMGSSHMEAAQVSEQENVGYLLNEEVDDYKTYNIGMSGHTIYRCIDNLDNALAEYNPKKYVVMVIDTVDLSVDEMNAVIEGKAEAIPSYDEGIVYYLQKIPAIKVIYKQLSDWTSLSSAGMTVFAYENINSDDRNTYEKTVEKFLGRISDLVEDEGIVPIVVYQPAQKVQNDGSLIYEYDLDNISVFARVCEEQGIEFLNVESRFDELYIKDKKLAHGFTNSSVGEGHLNKYGHKAIAEAIASRIQELEAQ